MQISLLIFYTSRKDQGKVIMSSPRTSKNFQKLNEQIQLVLTFIFWKKSKTPKTF